MAKFYNLDKAGFGGNHSTWWYWKSLVSAGATVTASGSGTGGSYSAAGDVYDPAGGNPYNSTAGVASGKLGSGVGTEPWMAAPRGWNLLTLQDGSQLCISRTSGAGDGNDGYWNFEFFPNGDAILVGCNANTAPTTATSGKVRVLHGGTMNGVGVLLFSAGTIGTRSHAMANGTASPAGGYTSAIIEICPPNTLAGYFALDALLQAKSDLFQPGPPSPAPGKVPYVLVGYGGATGLDTTVIGTSSATGAAPAPYPFVLMDFNGGSESWDRVTYTYHVQSGGTLHIPNSGGAPAAGQPDVPIVVCQRLHGGILGISDLFEWQATSRSYPDRDAALTGFYVGQVFAKILDGVTVPSAVP